MRVSGFHFLAFSAMVACHSPDVAPIEQTATTDPPPPPIVTVATASAVVVTDDAAPSPWPITHTIVETDHLHRVDLRIGDFLETPALDEFVWSPQPNDLLQTVKVDAGARVRFKATKVGSTQLVVRGDPKCRALDASCGTSVREWTVFVIVK